VTPHPAPDRHELFLRLFTASERAIRAHVRRLVPTPADCDDVMQEAAVVLWRKFDEFDPARSFQGWAFGVAKLEVRSWRRRKGRDHELLTDELIDLLAAESELQESALAIQRQLLAVCLERLEPRQRQLLLAAYHPGTKIQDVAAHSGRSIGGFYQWLHRMKRTLLSCVQDQLPTHHPSTGLDHA